ILYTNSAGLLGQPFIHAHKWIRAGSFPRRREMQSSLQSSRAAVSASNSPVRGAHPRVTLAAAAACAVSLLAIQSASAQTPVNNWIGPVSPTVGLWSDAANWDQGVPTIAGTRADDVFFGTSALSIDLGVSPL